MAKQKYYVVWKGVKPGIYNSWDETRANIFGFKGANYKAFASLLEAKDAFLVSDETTLKPDSICVDAACSGNPGPTEYKGVITNTKKIIFQSALIPHGTNNLGEYLAIVHALALCKKRNQDTLIYSDSYTAITWVKNRKVKSKLEKNINTEPIWNLVNRATLWLNKNTYQNPIHKWDTNNWGEIHADFGRKNEIKKGI
jgi:ribonuclease HI